MEHLAYERTSLMPCYGSYEMIRKSFQSYTTNTKCLNDIKNSALEITTTI